MPGAMQTVGGKVNISEATFTRENDTTTYAAGDVMAASTTAAVALVFESSAAYSGGSGIIQSVVLIDSAYQALGLAADLFLFNAEPASFGNDNAAFTPTDAELQTLVGIVEFSATEWNGGNLTSGANGNAVQLQTVSIPFKCANLTSKLYGVLVARNAYVPIASSPFFIRLHILQD